MLKLSRYIKKHWRSGGRVLGENHPDYANSLDNLALLYMHMGDYAQAEPLYQKALEIRRSTLVKTILIMRIV